MRTADKPDKGACRRSVIRELSLQCREGESEGWRGARAWHVSHSHRIECNRALNKDRALRNPIIDWSKVSQLAQTKEKSIGKLISIFDFDVAGQEIPTYCAIDGLNAYSKVFCMPHKVQYRIHSTRVAVACNINYNVVIES